MGGDWLEVSVLDCFPSVPVLIRRRRLGAGECLPGLLTGDCVEWDGFDRQDCRVWFSIPEAGVCGCHIDDSFCVLRYVVTSYLVDSGCWMETLLV